MLLRSLLQRYLPNHLYERPKQGFSIPLADWLRGPLKSWAEDLLSYESIGHDSHLDPKAVYHMWQSHLNGRDFHYPLWNILMYLSWRNVWL